MHHIDDDKKKHVEKPPMKVKKPAAMLIQTKKGDTIMDLDRSKWIEMMVHQWNESNKCITTFLDDSQVKIGIAVLQNVLNIKSVISLDTNNYLTFCMQQYCSNVSIETKNHCETRGTVSAMCINCYSTKRQIERKNHRSAQESSIYENKLEMSSHTD